MKNKTWMLQYYRERTYAPLPLEDFEQQAAQAAALGAELIFLSDIPKRREEWTCQEGDPYPNWGMMQTSLFKLAVPQALKPWLDEDYADANRALLAERSRIARRHGLKAGLVLIDPFYLPEEAYLAHPNWRGPRCDHPRRSRKAYFSPCVDEPEVLELYREAITKLCSEVELAYIQIVTNDSGAGLCWSHGLYSGENGPAACRDVPLPQRLLGFLNVFTRAAADCGQQITVDLTSDIIGFKKPDPALALCYGSLQPGQLLSGRDHTGRRPGFQYIFMPYEHVRPLRGIAFPLSFSRILWEQENGDAQWLKLILPESPNREYESVLQAWRKAGGAQYTDLLAVQQRAAALAGGAENASLLLEVWTEMEAAMEQLSALQLDNFVMMPLVSQRLINRPLVPFPAELTGEESDYYSPYLFQATTQEQADDYMNIQGMQFLSGFSAARITGLCCAQALRRLEKAIRLLDGMVPNDLWSRGSIALQQDRLRVLCCLIATLSHAAHYQAILDHTSPDDAPALRTVWPIPGDERIQRMNEIAREEIDNTYRLAALLRGRTEQFFVVTEPEAGEDIFLLSRELPDQLEQKARTMLRHLRDAERRYETPNR